MVTLGVPGGKKPTGGDAGEPGSDPIDGRLESGHLPVDNSAHEKAVDRRRFLRTAGKTGVALGAVAWATPLVQTTVPAWAATGSGGPGGGPPGGGPPGGGPPGGGPPGGGPPGNQGSAGVDVRAGATAGDSARDVSATAEGRAATNDGASNGHKPGDPSRATVEANGTVGAGAHAEDQGTAEAASAHADVDPRRLAAFGGGAIALGSAVVGTRNRILKPHDSTHGTPPEDPPESSRGPA